ncbi:MAG: efflux RND transporter periplasmic adaptor subunit [Acidobacteriota bacterium]
MPVTRRKKIAAVVIAALILIAAILYHWLSTRPQPLIYSGTIETREIEVGSKVGGRVTAVNVEEGQHVAASATLVTFEHDELNAQLAAAQANAQQAQADLTRLQNGNRPEEIAQADAAAQQAQAQLAAAQNGPRPQDIAQAQADYEAAKANATNAALTYSRMQPLVEKDVISRQQFDEYTAQRKATAATAESARQRLAELQAGTRAEDLQAAQQRYQQALAAAKLSHQGFRQTDIAAGKARLDAAQAQVQQIEANLREASLNAPAEGLVETVSVRPGDLIAPGKIVLTMLEPSQLWLKVYVPETDLSHVRIGQSAQVTVDSLHQTFNGSVQQIDASAQFLPRNVQTRDDREHQVFGLKIHVDNPNGVLKSGMSATVQLQ